ncbi:MAG: DUF692 domain-containing protein [Rhodocyclales bacterium]|nr:DUF692 domain-containing protein [Rhodocyclales bacterium]
MSELPAQAGIGLRAPHYSEVLATRPDIAWLEVHSENFFVPGGEALRVLDAVRQSYPVSLHGVGLSLGSSDELNQEHLRKLKVLIERVQPAAVSEHLCWSSIGGRYLNDLLPLPYSEEALTGVCERIRRAQDFIGRRIMIENVSSYVRFRGAAMPEWEFLVEVARRSDCDILLDVNNIFVSAANHGFDALDYLHAIPAERVGEIHLAGYETDESEPTDEDFLVDTHSRPVSDAVWALYAETLRRLGPQPTLIEWDNDIPALAVLLAEAGKAQALLETCEEHLHARAA